MIRSEVLALSERIGGSSTILRTSPSDAGGRYVITPRSMHSVGRIGGFDVGAVVGMVVGVLGGDAVVHRAAMDDLGEAALCVVGIGDGFCGLDCAG